MIRAVSIPKLIKELRTSDAEKRKLAEIIRASNARLEEIDGLNDDLMWARRFLAYVRHYNSGTYFIEQHDVMFKMLPEESNTFSIEDETNITTTYTIEAINVMYVASIICKDEKYYIKISIQDRHKYSDDVKTFIRDNMQYSISTTYDGIRYSPITTSCEIDMLVEVAFNETYGIRIRPKKFRNGSQMHVIYFANPSECPLVSSNDALYYFTKELVSKN